MAEYQEVALGKKSTARYLLPSAEAMRAELGVTVSRLAGSSNISRATLAKVLSGEPTQRASVEKVIAGLQKLGHPTASMDDIHEGDEERKNTDDPGPSSR